MIKSICIILFTCCFQMLMQSQVNGFGIKGGPSLCYQNWGNSQRDPLLQWHVAAFIDSESSDSKSIIYGQLGYHVKGSGIRYAYSVDINGNRYPGGTASMEFRNLSLDIGIKKFISTGTWSPYYAIGLRGEYTLSTKFETYYNLDNFDYINRWNYGFSLKIGTELKLKKLVHCGFELNIAPDLSKQIYVSPDVPTYDPFTRTSHRLGYEISVINTTIELSFYLRFLQLIQYD